MLNHKTHVAKRVSNHQIMKKLMADGLHLSALNLGQKTLTESGPHIGLLCDIVCCQYQLGFFSSCSEMISLVIKEYELASDFLSFDSSRRTLIFVSKIQEELGMVSESLESLSKAYAFCESKQDFRMILTQELRLMSYLGLKDKILDKMSIVNQKSDDSYSDRIEVLHTLLWSEYCLFGFETASKTFLKLVNENLSQSDSRLVYRDFLEITCLAQAEKNHVALMAVKSFKEISHLQSFDLFLLDCFFAHDKSNNYLFNNDLSVMQKLRMLIMNANRFNTTNVSKAIYLTQFSLLTQHLSLHNQKILKCLMPKMNLNSSEAIIINLNQFTDLQQRILILFEKKNKYDLTELAHQLWNEEYADVHYDRLRMLVYKLNKSMVSVTSSAIFSISKNEIKLNQKIIIAA